MRRLALILGFILVLIPFLSGCSEVSEGVDKNNDIIVRNISETELWISIDGSRRGRIENDGGSHTMWDHISDGVHVLIAFDDADYSIVHCVINTDYLSDGEDFYWYLLEDYQYSGTKDGDC